MEDYGMSVHFVNTPIDKDGSGQKLIQYSYISLKHDALHWLRENGRLPSSSTEEYFEEIQNLNKYKLENAKYKDETEDHNSSAQISMGCCRRESLEPWEM